MRDIVIYADSSCDLDYEVLSKLKVKFIPLLTTIGDKTYEDRTEIKPKEFYSLIREDNSVLPTTTQITPHRFVEALKEDVNNGKKILVITISSGLSSTYNSLHIAKEMLEYEDIYPVDSKGASMGVGLMVMKAAKMAENGECIENILKEMEHMVANMEYIFFPGSLDMLKRGGRISATRAVIGNILSIKPICNIKDGKIQMIDKVRGEKSAIKYFINYVKEAGYCEKYGLGISHGSNIELCNGLKEKLVKELHEDKLVNSEIGPVIGTHAGEGTLAMFFVKK